MSKIGRCTQRSRLGKRKACQTLRAGTTLRAVKGLQWKGCTFTRKASLLVATGFGLGLSPFAPGTMGTALGVLMVMGLPRVAIVGQICFAGVLAIMAVPMCDLAEKHFGSKDDRRIVADEYLTFPICIVALPWQSAPWLLALAFVTHRLFDIIKPFPARRLQKLPGGKGIVVDDVISSLYALAVNHAVWWLVVAYGAQAT